MSQTSEPPAGAGRGRVLSPADVADATPLYPAARLLPGSYLEADALLAQAQQRLDAAQAEADQILATAREQAEQVLAAARASVDSEREKAIEAARSEVATAMGAALRRLDQEVSAVRERYPQDVWSAGLAVARKVLDIEFRTEPRHVVEMVKGVLKSARKYHEITIFVHPDDLEFVGAKEAELRQLCVFANAFRILDDESLPRHGVRVETGEGGQYQATLKSAIDAIEDALRKEGKL
ncbi:MAG: FliH/SctL family protein [Planctomycetota bacterium]